MSQAPSEFDLLVVGAGSAGCALTRRLVASSGLSIGLVEAGPDYGPLVGGRWPAELLDARRSPKTHDWGFAHSRARVIGGCSSHNQCGIFRAQPGDYDRWATAGALGWTDAELAPFVVEAEQVLSPRRHRDDELTTWQRAFLESAMAAGFPRVDKLNDARTGEGVAPFFANVRGTFRWNAAFAFLDPVREHPGLRVIPHTLVDRLIMEGGRATALTCWRDGARLTLHAQRFVLCAGAYGSPTILLRSGVGPMDELGRLGIPICLALSGVGSNLHDHPGIALDYEPSRRIRREFEDELASGRFYQAQVNLGAGGGMTPDHHDLDVFPYQMMDDAGVWRFLLMAFLLAPRSRGRMRLAGLDPGQPPHIDLQFLSDTAGHDVVALLSGVQLIRRIAQSHSLRNAIERELIPGPSLDSDHELAEFARSHVEGYAHPVGTCRMGPASDRDAVVGADGHVHGTENVFVADASIIPEIPRAPINLTCMVIGLRVAELLLSGKSEA